MALGDDEWRFAVGFYSEFIQGNVNTTTSVGGQKQKGVVTKYQRP